MNADFQVQLSKIGLSRILQFNEFYYNLYRINMCNNINKFNNTSKAYSTLDL